MYWNFILDDGTTQLTLITQPLGWDSGTATITRDTEKHGVAFDYAIGNIRYYAEGYDFLKAAYETLQTEAKVNLTIQYKCSFIDTVWTDFYTGKLNFGTYREFAGIDCYVMLNVEATDVVMTLNNRFDQKVDLDTTASFDGVFLQSYDFLGTDIELKAKAIPVQNVFKNTNDNILDYVGGLQPITNTITNLNYTRSQITVGFDTVAANEIGAAYTTTEQTNIDINDSGGGVHNFFELTFCDFGAAKQTVADFWPLYSAPLINFNRDSPSYGWLNGVTSFDFTIAGRITAENTKISWISYALVLLKDRGSLQQTCGGIPHANGEAACDYNTQSCNIALHTITQGGNIYAPPGYTPGGTPLPDNLKLQNGQYVDFNITPNFLTDTGFEEGDRIYLMINLFEEKNQTMIDACQAGGVAYTLKLNEGNEFIMRNTSRGGTNTKSFCKSYLVNEALSRVTEAITNDQMRVYSDYFGRTDAEPYPSAANGCGGLEMVSNGLFIRGMDRVRTDTPPIMSVSLDDLFKGLNPIHNIGFGIEDDPNRAGFKLLRVEPMQYFYPNNVIFSATNIEVLTRSCVPGQIYSKYLFGYEKWEAQQFTGLDEFLTKREYRTSLTSVNNTLSQISSFIASGYTIEIVRRLGNTTSQDNSYDNETFIVCLKLTEPGESFNINYTFNPNQGGQLVVSGASFAAYAEANPGRIDFVYNGVHYYMIPSSIDTTNGMVVANVTDFNNSGINTPAVFTIYQGGTYSVEQGNIINATNIIDPPTIYNYRISPIHNAMRWVKAIFQSYRGKPEEIIFTDGDGNVYASGQLPAGDPCKLENSNITENMTVAPAIFANVADATPVFLPELITFDYPVSVEDFINIKSNRTGLIEYEYKGVTRQGWISELKYTFETGIATFQLIPKYV